MAIELCILASGSSGNAGLLRTPAGCFLIDAGIGPRTTAQRLAGTGCSIEHVRAIVLTHLDRDHFSPTWLGTIIKQQIPIYVHYRRRDELLCLAENEQPERRLVSQFEPLLRIFREEPFTPFQGVEFFPLKFAHDGAGSHGFVVDGFDCRIGYATDLGRVPEQLLKAFADLDILALESNYDPHMQMNSPRPAFLKRRIMGGAGHLSNTQALAAVQQILDQHQARLAPLPSHIVLLHRSRQCNCPQLLRKMFCADLRIAPRLTLAHQHQRTEWLSPKSVAPRFGEQLVFAM